MQAANRNLQLEIIYPEPEIHVSADPRRFQQVLVGLVHTSIAQMEEGGIKVWAASFPESEQARIWIDVQSQSHVWSEPVDLLATTPEIGTKPSETYEISPGLTLLMVQTLVEVMQGRLEVLTLSSEESTGDSASKNLTRFECSIPLAAPETVEQLSAED
jgi:hypothetical protein